jgi:hypothetical protein
LSLDPRALLLTPRNSMLDVTPPILTKIAAYLATFLGVRASEAKEQIPRQLKQWGRLQISNGGDLIQARGFHKLRSDGRDSSYVRVSPPSPPHILHKLIRQTSMSFLSTWTPTGRELQNGLNKSVTTDKSTEYLPFHSVHERVSTTQNILKLSFWLSYMKRWSLWRKPTSIQSCGMKVPLVAAKWLMHKRFNVLWAVFRTTSVTGSLIVVQIAT